MTNFDYKDPIIDVLRKQIDASMDGRITFEQYMEICLYHPVFGYYNRPKPKIGKDGDFYTSAFIGSIMGEMIVRYMMEQILIDPSKPLCITEWGAGDGRLTKDIIEALKRGYPGWYNQLEYIAIESSSYHRTLFRRNLGTHLHKVTLIDEENERVSGHKNHVIIANEFLDALPVRRISKHNHTLYEHWVCFDEAEDRFCETFNELEDRQILNYIHKHAIHVHEGQTVEINLKAAAWIQRTVQQYPQGFWLIIDYGDVTEELYSPYRMNGTFLCYHQHVAYDDPFRFPGRQDMTAHVDFASCAREVSRTGELDTTLLTQKEFLLRAGILSELAAHSESDPFHPAAKRNRAIRQLLISDQMSELFKVFLMHKK